MAAVFPGKDFVSPHWQTLAAIAHPYPNALPGLSAIAFDRVKDGVCAYRGYPLCSADALTIAADGRIWFIEFKDAKANPTARLRKKAFDGLLLFWLALGQGLSMEDIRKRAVFCYVVPDGTSVSVSNQFASLLASSAGMTLPQPQPSQLSYLLTTGLFNDVKTVQTSVFLRLAQVERFATSLAEVRTRIALAPPTLHHAHHVPAAIPNSVFSRCVEPILALRMVDPNLALANTRNSMLLADTYNVATETVSYRHDWSSVRHPIISLATRSFDTFVIWAAALYSQRTLASLGGVLVADVAFQGSPPPFPCPQPPQFLIDFWTAWSPFFGCKNGLALHERENLYASISTTP